MIMEDYEDYSPESYEPIEEKKSFRRVLLIRILKTPLTILMLFLWIYSGYFSIVNQDYTTIIIFSVIAIMYLIGIIVNR